MDNEKIINYEIIKNIESEHDNNLLKKYLASCHPFDIANVFEQLEKEDRYRLYSILDNDFLASIFAYIDSDVAANYLEEMDASKSSMILNEMDVDDAADIVLELDDPNSIVSMLDTDTVNDINILASYDENSAGSIMTTNFISVESKMDVKDAMKIVVHSASDMELIDPIFVTEDNKLVGLLNLKDLIIARSPQSIDKIMNTSFQFVNTSDSLDEVNNIVNKYDTYALPVLENEILKGIITIDDAFESIYETYKQDYKQFAAINDIEHDDNLFKTIFKRLPWLIVLLVLSLLITNVTNIYDDVIKQVVVLAFFQTMLLDMAGNIGTQSLGVTIQKVSNQTIVTFRDEVKHIFREIRVGFLNSLILTFFSFGVCYLYMLATYSGEFSIALISLSISLSLFLTLLISSMFSTVLPLLLKRIHIDPAIASGPFISTLNDVISIIIYFNVARLILGLVI